jgi:hypothetical protein
VTRRHRGLGSHILCWEVRFGGLLVVSAAVALVPFTCSEAHSRNGGSYSAPQGQNPILLHHLFLGIGAKKVQGAGGQGRGQRMAVLFSLDKDKGAGDARACATAGGTARREKGMISQMEVCACAQTMRPWENGRCAFFPTFMNACLVFKLPPLTFFCICVRIMSKGCKSAEAETPDRLPLIHDAVTDTLPSPPVTPPIPAPTSPIPARVTCLERNTSCASPGRDFTSPAVEKWQQPPQAGLKIRAASDPALARLGETFLSSCFHNKHPPHTNQKMIG